MFKDLAAKLEVAMHGAIYFCVLLMVLSAAVLGAYLAAASCVRIVQLLHTLVYNHRW